MPNDYDDDDLDTDLPKQLRKQLNEKDKALKELTEKFEAVARRDRERTLTEVFKEKGLPPKAAKFFPNDVEATEDSINSWVEEYADVFGLQKQAAPQDQQGEASPQIPDAYARLQKITAPSTQTGGEADVLHAINNANEADLIALITAAGGGGL